MLMPYCFHASEECTTSDVVGRQLQQFGRALELTVLDHHDEARVTGKRAANLGAQPVPERAAGQAAAREERHQRGCARRHRQRHRVALQRPSPDVVRLGDRVLGRRQVVGDRRGAAGRRGAPAAAPGGRRLQRARSRVTMLRPCSCASSSSGAGSRRRTSAWLRKSETTTTASSARTRVSITTITVSTDVASTYRHPASCVHVNWSTAPEQLQLRQSIRHGIMQVMMRHMMGVTWGICVLHCP